MFKIKEHSGFPRGLFWGRGEPPPQHLVTPHCPLTPPPPPKLREVLPKPLEPAGNPDTVRILLLIPM